MTETQFDTLVIIAFVVVVIGVTVSFTYFVRWFKRDTTVRPTPEAMLLRQEELDARFRKLHPDTDEESSDA